MKTLARLLVYAAWLLPCFGAAAEDLTYVIQPGDTLSAIASEQLGNAAAWRELQRLNRISDPNKLTPGGTLRIPAHLGGLDVAEAEVLHARGAVTGRRNADAPAEPLVQGARLRAGSLVETHEDGVLTLRFADRSRMLVSPNSRLTLALLQRTRGNGEALTRATLEAGRIESHINPQPGTKARFEVRTPSLNLAVRGTTFRVQLDGKTGLTRSSVLEGEVMASNPKGAVRLPAGFGTSAAPGQAPGAPRALLPPPQLSPGTTPVDHFPAQFAWQNLGDARQYRVEIVASADEERLLQSITTEVARAAWTALPNGAYRLRVRGIDAEGLEGRDAMFDFKVAAWPSAPMVHSPLEGSTASGEKISFRWARVGDSDFVRFQVARDPEFKDIAMQVKALTSRSGGIALPLAPGRYYWRIASGKRPDSAGPFGPVQSFEVALHPSSASRNLLRWQAGQPGERYRVQVAAHESFAEPLVDAEQTASEVTLPDLPRTLFVRLKRIAKDGFPGDFEPVQAFEPAR